jgi:hypothetical protein
LTCQCEKGIKTKTTTTIFKTYKLLVMKTQSTNLFEQISKTQVESLTMEVKETLAMGYNHRKSKIFSAAELWNIQRQRKSLNQRRRFAY